MKISLKMLVPLLILMLGGCGSVPMQSGAERVSLYDVRELPDQQPRFEYDALGSVSGEDGSGCGLFGSFGDKEEARTAIFNNTAKLGGDTLLLSYYERPHLSGLCRSNKYVYKGIAANRWWPHYVMPAPLEKISQTVEIKGSYDAVWSALVDYVSSSFFKISTYEKESGLLTLDFSESDISKYVDCGTWELRTWDKTLKNSEAYTSEFQDSMNLAGQMNLRVKQKPNGVIALYVNTLYDLNMTIKHTKHRTKTYKWNFVTNKSATTNVINNPKTKEKEPRTCKPSNTAENYILNGIKAVAVK